MGSEMCIRDREYIAENQSQIPYETPPKPIAGYDAMIGSDDIDALYIPLPTAVRKSYVLKAAAAGKHVLCEKPCGVDASHLQEMIDACASAGVQFMDGVMFMHHRRFELLRRRIADLKFSPTFMDSAFTFKADAPYLRSNIRTSIDTEPLGCVGDLGWYSIRMALTLMQNVPCVVRARHHDMYGGVPIHTCLLYTSDAADE